MPRIKTKRKNEQPAYIVGRGCAGWHSAQRETWSLEARPDRPRDPYQHKEYASSSGLTEDEARARVVPGCVCYDFSAHGYDGGCQACRLPTRGWIGEIREPDDRFAVRLWQALWDMQVDWPLMKCGIATEAGRFPWEGSNDCEER